MLYIMLYIYVICGYVILITQQRNDNNTTVIIRYELMMENLVTF